MSRAAFAGTPARSTGGLNPDRYKAASRPGPSPAAVRAVLQRTRDLIDLSWCRGAFARDIAGRAVDAKSGNAHSWDLIGAGHRAAVDHDPRAGSAARSLLHGCASELGHGASLGRLNDAGDFDAVMSVVDLAIERTGQ